MRVPGLGQGHLKNALDKTQRHLWENKSGTLANKIASGLVRNLQYIYGAGEGAKQYVADRSASARRRILQSKMGQATSTWFAKQKTNFAVRKDVVKTAANEHGNKHALHAAGIGVAKTSKTFNFLWFHKREATPEKKHESEVPQLGKENGLFPKEVELTGDSKGSAALHVDYSADDGKRLRGENKVLLQESAWSNELDNVKQARQIAQDVIQSQNINSDSDSNSSTSERAPLLGRNGQGRQDREIAKKIAKQQAQQLEKPHVSHKFNGSNPEHIDALRKTIEGLFGEESKYKQTKIATRILPGTDMLVLTNAAAALCGHYGLTAADAAKAIECLTHVKLYDAIGNPFGEAGAKPAGFEEQDHGNAWRLAIELERCGGAGFLVLLHLQGIEAPSLGMTGDRRHDMLHTYLQAAGEKLKEEARHINNVPPKNSEERVRRKDFDDHKSDLIKLLGADLRNMMPDPRSLHNFINAKHGLESNHGPGYLRRADGKPNYKGQAFSSIGEKATPVEKATLVEKAIKAVSNHMQQAQNFMATVKDANGAKLVFAPYRCDKDGEPNKAIEMVITADCNAWAASLVRNGVYTDDVYIDEQNKVKSDFTLMQEHMKKMAVYTNRAMGKADNGGALENWDKALKNTIRALNPKLGKSPFSALAKNVDYKNLEKDEIPSLIAAGTGYGGIRDGEEIKHNMINTVRDAIAKRGGGVRTLADGRRQLQPLFSEAGDKVKQNANPPELAQLVRWSILQNAQRFHGTKVDGKPQWGALMFIVGHVDGVPLDAHYVENAKKLVYEKLAGGYAGQDIMTRMTIDNLFKSENVERSPERLLKWSEGLGLPAAFEDILTAGNLDNLLGRSDDKDNPITEEERANLMGVLDTAIKKLRGEITSDGVNAKKIENSTFQAGSKVISQSAVAYAGSEKSLEDVMKDTMDAWSKEWDSSEADSKLRTDFLHPSDTLNKILNTPIKGADDEATALEYVVPTGCKAGDWDTFKKAVDHQLAWDKEPLRTWTENPSKNDKGVLEIDGAEIIKLYKQIIVDTKLQAIDAKKILIDGIRTFGVDYLQAKIGELYEAKGYVAKGTKPTFTGIPKDQFSEEQEEWAGFADVLERVRLNRLKKIPNAHLPPNEIETTADFAKLMRALVAEQRLGHVMRFTDGGQDGLGLPFGKALLGAINVTPSIYSQKTAEIQFSTGTAERALMIGTSRKYNQKLEVGVTGATISETGDIEDKKGLICRFRRVHSGVDSDNVGNAQLGHLTQLLMDPDGAKNDDSFAKPVGNDKNSILKRAMQEFGDLSVGLYGANTKNLAGGASVGSSLASGNLAAGDGPWIPLIPVVGIEGSAITGHMKWTEKCGSLKVEKEHKSIDYKVNVTAAVANLAKTLKALTGFKLDPSILPLFKNPDLIKEFLAGNAAGSPWNGSMEVIRTGQTARHIWIEHDGALMDNPGICSYYQVAHKNAMSYFVSLMSKIERFAVDKVKAFEGPHYFGKFDTAVEDLTEEEVSQRARAQESLYHLQEQKRAVLMPAAIRDQRTSLLVELGNLPGENATPEEEQERASLRIEINRLNDLLRGVQVGGAQEDWNDYLFAEKTSAPLLAQLRTLYDTPTAPGSRIDPLAEQKQALRGDIDTWNAVSKLLIKPAQKAKIDALQDKIDAEQKNFDAPMLTAEQITKRDEIFKEIADLKEQERNVMTQQTQHVAAIDAEIQRAVSTYKRAHPNATRHVFNSIKNLLAQRDTAISQQSKDTIKSIQDQIKAKKDEYKAMVAIKADKLQLRQEYISTQINNLLMDGWKALKAHPTDEFREYLEYSKDFIKMYNDITSALRSEKNIVGWEKNSAAKERVIDLENQLADLKSLRDKAIEEHAEGRFVIRDNLQKKAKSNGAKFLVFKTRETAFETSRIDMYA